MSILANPVATPELASIAAVDSRHESHRRYRRIFAAGVSALLGRGIGLLVSVITVPLTVRYLGAERYGLWMTISSTVTMFFALDIGIASTLTNLISQAYAKNDRRQAAIYFATALWTVVGVSAILALLGCALWPQVNWASAFHLPDGGLSREAARATAAALLIFVFALPASLAPRVLGGYQELHTANLFTAAGSILSLLVVIAVVQFRGSLTVLVAGYAGSSLAANAAALLWICLHHKPWLKPWPRLVQINVINKVVASGVQFFLIQLAGLIVFSSDNLVIAHYLSAAEVTPYSVTWKLVSLATVFQSIAVLSLWPAYAEAYSKQQLDWIRAAYNRMRWITVCSLTAACALLIPFGRAIIRTWAGPPAVPSNTLMLLMCVWMVLFAVTSNQSCLMGATGRVRRQAVSSCLAAAANLGLSIWWVRTMGVVGVLLGTVVSYLIFVVLVQMHEVRAVLRGES